MHTTHSHNLRSSLMSNGCLWTMSSDMVMLSHVPSMTGCCQGIQSSACWLFLLFTELRFTQHRYGPYFYISPDRYKSDSFVQVHSKNKIAVRVVDSCLTLEYVYVNLYGTHQLTDCIKHVSFSLRSASSIWASLPGLIAFLCVKFITSRLFGLCVRVLLVTTYILPFFYQEISKMYKENVFPGCRRQSW